MKNSTFSVDLDRIEEGIAVILSPGGFAWHLPAEFLPEGVTEGMTMKVTLQEDAEASQARVDRIQELRRKLENR